MTALHDTTISNLNHRIKEAHRQFKKIGDNLDLNLKATIDNPDIKTILELLKTATVAIDIIMEVLGDNSILVIGLAVAGGMVVIIILQTIVLVKFIRDIKMDIMRINLKFQELEKQTEQGNKPERASGISDQEMKNAVTLAVNEAVEMSVRNAMGCTVVRTHGQVIDHVDTNPRLTHGTRFNGNILSLQSGTRQGPI